MIPVCGSFHCCPDYHIWRAEEPPQQEHSIYMALLRTGGSLFCWRRVEEEGNCTAMPSFQADWADCAPLDSAGAGAARFDSLVREEYAAWGAMLVAVNASLVQQGGAGLQPGSLSGDELPGGAVGGAGGDVEGGGGSAGASSGAAPVSHETTKRLLRCKPGQTLCLHLRGGGGV